MDPMTALSIAKGAASFIEARNKANRDEALYQQNGIAATQSRDLQIQQLNARAIQEAEAASQQKFEQSIRALELRESRRTISGEAGLGGQTEALKIANVTAKQLRQESAINQQLKGTLAQIDLNKAGVNAQALQRINSMQRGVQPDLLMSGISIASSAIASDMKYGSDVFGLSEKAKAMANGTDLLSTNTANMPTVDKFVIN